MLECDKSRTSFLGGPGQIPVSPASITKPPLSEVLDYIRLCGQEFLDNYILLDAKVDTFRHGTALLDVNTAENTLQYFKNILEFLRNELRADAARCNAKLSETT